MIKWPIGRLQESLKFTILVNDLQTLSFSGYLTSCITRCTLKKNKMENLVKIGKNDFL
ncbi:MAG: hypothetical protein BWX87_02755 [Bacteroidetes bacterium ADurb.Bin123]|jgi:hypothetical protein|nr:MAG: hypothetical protein BWX87_02755 [Bacteroidetes bacterium ADurb.Bin123]